MSPPAGGEMATAMGGAGPGPGTAASRVAQKRAAELADGDDAEASLRKRMAGPSSGKAGLSADQEEINRKIYEASRGSKFFENERVKDAETTKRINQLLAKRDDALSRVAVDSAEWKAIGKKIDLRLAELEATRDLSHQICHVDADQFYAAVELKRDPTLKGKAFGVGSGVLTTASYEARQKGCRSGQAVFVAKALCPELIVVPNNFQSYIQASSEVMEILGSYDENLQPASLDEAYLDITSYCHNHNMTAEQVVTQLRKEIQEETGLTVSVGIAANKTLAKICSDKNKPNGQYALAHDREVIMHFMDTLPVRKIPGIGRVTERILSSVNVVTCGDIWKHRHELHLTFGNSLDQLLSAYLGLGSTVVRPNDRRERKSVGRETTFRPTNDLELFKAELRGCADQVEKDLERNHFKGRTVTLVAKKDTFQRFTRAKSGTAFLHKADDLYNITVALLMAEIAECEKADPGAKLTLRLIGIRVTHLKDLQPPNNQIKKLFEAAGAKGASVKSTSRAVRDENDELQEAIRLSLAEATGLAVQGSALLTRGQHDCWDHDQDQHQDRDQNRPSNVDNDRADTTALVSGEEIEIAAMLTKSRMEKAVPVVTASSFSPPRPKAPEKNRSLSFKDVPQPASGSGQGNANSEDIGPKGQAIPRTSSCPICQAELSYWSNAELNRQIDACLEGRGHQVSGIKRSESPTLATQAPIAHTRSSGPRKSVGRSGGIATVEKVNARTGASRAGKDVSPGEKSKNTAGPLDMWLSKK